MKTVLITGSTGSIGAAAAKAFAGTGAEVILVARNKNKAEKVKAEILAAFPKAVLSILIADMTDFDSIKKMAQEFNSKYSKLDLFINSSAVYKETKNILSNGFEETFAANYLGYFLMVNLLLDKMKQSPQSLLLNIVPPTKVNIDFSDLQKLKNFGSLKSFNHTSALKIRFTRELAERLKGTTVSAINFNPGFVKNQTQEQIRGVVGVVLRTAAALFADEPDKTGGVLLQLVKNFNPDEGNGKFYNNKIRFKPDASPQDKAIGKQLWEETCKLLGINP